MDDILLLGDAHAQIIRLHGRNLAQLTLSCKSQNLSRRTIQPIHVANAHPAAGAPRPDIGSRLCAQRRPQRLRASSWVEPSERTRSCEFAATGLSGTVAVRPCASRRLAFDTVAARRSTTHRLELSWPR